MNIKSFLFVSVCLLFCSCDNEQMKEYNTLKVNEFIRDCMQEAYLWSEQMPNLDINKESNPKQYFKKLLYSEDCWSYITDDAKSLTNSLKGIEMTFGYQLVFYKVTDDEYFAVVEYVVPNTAADRAGIKRGDYFVRINGEKINSNNYKNFVSASEITLTKGKWADSNVVETQENVSLTATVETINPILLSKIVTKNGCKIGYLVYNSFIGDFNSSLEEVLRNFKENGVEELVLDLRYNSGGDETASTFLCSSLAPKSVVESESVLIRNHWNSNYESYWRSKGKTELLERRFDKSVECNLNLNRLFVLTSKNSASASELTIVGLSPYMNVVQIGQTTYGKYTSMFLFQPNLSTIKNWALLPIVAKYANSKGFTDFKDGLSPDYYVEDNLFPAVQLGDENEPLLAKAIEIITGDVSLSMQKIPTKFELLGSEFSKFDAIKQNDFIKVPIHVLNECEFD